MSTPSHSVTSSPAESSDGPPHSVRPGDRAVVATATSVNQGHQPPAGVPPELHLDMDPTVTTIQPGGGVVMSMELAWGGMRRFFLRKLRPRYVARMADRRQGQRGDLPFDPVDSRDMKYYRNQGSYWWADADDPFLWRDSLPFVRVGLAELFVLGGSFLLLAVLAGLLWWPLALPPLVVFGLIVWFFRDPKRVVPGGVGTVVSPADGKLVEIVEVDDPVIGPALRFGVFLSIFNVHANRVSLPGRVVSVRYRPGKFLNALRPESARENENLDIELASNDLDGKIIRIRQITGQFARRIVCWARVGDVFERGEMYGMIKLGSRTELVIPREPGLQIEAKIGDKISAGSTVMARYQIVAGPRKVSKMVPAAETDLAPEIILAPKNIPASDPNSAAASLPVADSPPAADEHRP